MKMTIYTPTFLNLESYISRVVQAKHENISESCLPKNVEGIAGKKLIS